MAKANGSVGGVDVTTGEIVGENVQEITMSNPFDVSNGGYVRFLQDFGGRPTPMVPVVERHTTGQIVITNGIAIPVLNNGPVGLAFAAAFQTVSNNGAEFFAALCRAPFNVRMALPAQVRGSSNWGSRQLGYIFQLTEEDAKAYACEKSFVRIQDGDKVLREIHGCVAVYEDALTQLQSNNGPLKLSMPIGNSKIMDVSVWEEGAAAVREKGEGFYHKNTVRNTGAVIESWGFPRGSQRATALGINPEAAANSVLNSVAAPVVTETRPQATGNAAQAQQQMNGRRQRSTILGSVSH